MFEPAPLNGPIRRTLVGGLVACLASCGSAPEGDASSPAPPGDGPRIVQPGSPGDESRVVPSGERIDTSHPHTAADVRFMQGMIHHHAQALAMTSLVEERAGSEDLRRLAYRIDISQQDEIALMQRWLEERSEDVPALDVETTHHLSGDEHVFMPGMLTHEQMSDLEEARGREFDRLFLEYMIQHHRGALVMVRDLFATEGAAYEAEIHQFASHVEADQSIEIRRMRAMLAELR